MSSKKVDRWPSIHAPKPSTHPHLFQPGPPCNPPGENLALLTGADRRDAWAMIQSDPAFAGMVAAFNAEFGKPEGLYFETSPSQP